MTLSQATPPNLLRSPRVEISLDNLLHNMREIRRIIPEKAGILAVVKDCAYGCGSIVIARTLEQQGGIRFFAVARPREAFALRQNGITGEILVLGIADEPALRAGSQQNITFTLNDLADLALWSSLDVKIRFHCNIDTGMARLGLQPHEIESLADCLGRTGNLLFDGAFTHLACADEPNTETVGRQKKLFKDSLELLRDRGFAPRHIHFCNSAGFLRFTSRDSTVVRPGIALYGCKPDPQQDFDAELRPVASLKGCVVKIKAVAAGTPVSYGGTHIIQRNALLATIGLGYAHGVPRFLSNRGSVLIGGKRYRIAGRVTMDYIMVDLGPESSVRTGDEAVVIGSQGSETISPDEIAAIGGTIGYEILCNLGTAIDRYYLSGGSIVLHEEGTIF